MPSRFEVDDGLWAEVQPLLPVIVRRRRNRVRAVVLCSQTADDNLSVRLDAEKMVDSVSDGICEPAAVSA